VICNTLTYCGLKNDIAMQSDRLVPEFNILVEIITRSLDIPDGRASCDVIRIRGELRGPHPVQAQHIRQKPPRTPQKEDSASDA
jgi:hypothetical protein